MKRLLHIVVTASILLAGCAEKEACTVSGRVVGIDDGTVYLGRFSPGSVEIVDSTFSRGGKFGFGLEEIYPDIYYISFQDVAASVPFVAERGTVNVYCDFDSDAVVEVGGTPSNDLVREYDSLKALYDAQIEELRLRKMSYSHEWDSAAFAAAVSGEMALEERKRASLEGLLRSGGSLAGAAYILSQTDTYGYDLRMMDSLIGVLSPSIAPSAFTDRLKSRRSALERTSPGMPAPDFALQSGTGETVSSGQFRGNYVLIHFWASWCGSCIADMPRLSRINSMYAGRGLKVVGISLDGEREKWLEAAEKHDITWTNLVSPRGWNSDAAKSYGVIGVPHYTLVDRDGRIVSGFISPANLEREIARIMDAEAAEGL